MILTYAFLQSQQIYPEAIESQSGMTMVAGLCHFVISRRKDATRKDERRNGTIQPPYMTLMHKPKFKSAKRLLS